MIKQITLNSKKKKVTDDSCFILCNYTLYRCITFLFERVLTGVMKKMSTMTPMPSVYTCLMIHPLLLADIGSISVW